MKGWIMFVLFYLLGSFFPVSRITSLFSGLGASKTKTASS